MPRKAQQPAWANALGGTLKGRSSGGHPPKGGYGSRNRQLSGALGERDRREDDGPAEELEEPERLPEPEKRDYGRGRRLEHRRDSGPRRRDVAERGDDERERDDRPEHDHPGDERPDRGVEPGQVAQERRAAGDDRAGERPPGLDGGPEERGEEEAVARERDRVAGRDGVLGDQDVEGIGQCRREAGRDAAAVEREPAPHLDDEREPGQRECERNPDPPSHVLAVHEARPERDEERREVLEEERDPDREAMDRYEVEPLDEREPEDAEEDERRQLTRTQPEPRRARQREDEGEADEGSGRPDLGEPRRRKAGVEDHLRDGAVDGEERRREQHHPVAEERASVARGRPRGQDRLDHPARLQG